MCVYVYIYTHTHIYVYTHTYICYIFFIHLSVDGHLGCCHILAIVATAALNVGVHIFFQISVLIFSRYIPESRIAGSYGSSVFIFIYLFIKKIFLNIFIGV